MPQKVNFILVFSFLANLLERCNKNILLIYYITVYIWTIYSVKACLAAVTAQVLGYDAVSFALLDLDIF